LALRFNIGRAIGKRWRVPESTTPIFDVVSDGTELTDGAIAALAALLLAAADRARKQSGLDSSDLALTQPNDELGLPDPADHQRGANDRHPQSNASAPRKGATDRERTPWGKGASIQELRCHD
jgi:hypothetical protein